MNTAIATRILAESSDDEAHEALQIVLQNRFKQSLYHTCRELCGYRDINKETHGEFIRALESPTKRKLLVMPRGSLKSSIGVVGFSIWNIIRNPNIRILIDSSLYTNSKNFVQEIKQHLESPFMVEVFGEFRGEAGWSEGSITIAQRTRPIKEATVTASGIESNKTSQHYDLIICDDLNDSSNSATIELRQKVIRHYQMNIAILENEGTLALIGTRYAADDVIGYVLKNEVQIADPGAS